jgi:hypothetical protein
MPEVIPTGPLPNEHYSDTAIANLFNAHVNSLNAEKQIIWHRFQAMLLGNSIIISFATKEAAEPIITLCTGIFGIFLCALWLWLNSIGWDLASKRSDAIRSFEWKGYENPQSLQLHKDVTASGSRDKFRMCAQCVVLLFAASHTSFIVWSAFRLLCT